MSRKYNPADAEGDSAQDKAPLPEDYYRFKVSQAKEKTSLSGNAMIELTLNVWNKSDSGTVKDFLGNWRYGAVKIVGFLDSIGLDSKSGEFSCSQVVGKQGYLKHQTKESTNPKYPGPQNSVGRYYTHADLVREGVVKPSAQAATAASEAPPAKADSATIAAVQTASEIADDDLPF